MSRPGRRNGLQFCIRGKVFTILRPPVEQLVISRIRSEEKPVRRPVDVSHARGVTEQSDRLFDVALGVQLGDVDVVVVGADGHSVTFRCDRDAIDLRQRQLVLLNGSLVVNVVALKYAFICQG